MKTIFKIIFALTVFMNMFGMVNAESLSNITKTNEDHYLGENIKNAEGYWSKTSSWFKEKYTSYITWYRRNNKTIEYLPYLDVKVMDFYSGIIIIGGILYILIKVLTKYW